MAEHLQKKHWGKIKVMVRAAGALSDSKKHTKINEQITTPQEQLLQTTGCQIMEDRTASLTRHGRYYDPFLGLLGDSRSSNRAPRTLLFLSSVLLVFLACCVLVLCWATPVLYRILRNH